MERINSFANVILAYQLVGTLILGYSLVMTTDRNIKYISTTILRGNRDIIESLVSQRWDAKFGIVILVLSLIGQFLENILKISDNQCLISINIFLFIFLIIVVGMYFLLKKKLVSIKKDNIYELPEKAKEIGR